MIRGRLYLKLFGWFVAASALAMIATLLVMRPLWHALDETTGEFGQWGHDAASIYEQRGSDALHDYLQELRRSRHVTAMLLGADGRPLTRLRMPPHVRDRLLGPVRQLSGPLADSGRLLRTRVRTQADQYEWRVLRPRPGPEQWRALGWVRLLIFLLVMALAALLFTAWLGRPIKRLRLATDGMAAGDLATRVDNTLTGRRDEIGELGQAFNNMAERIQALVENKKRLLRDVSHELRSPLARLEVALELARERSVDRATSELDRIDLETQRLKALIDQVMTLARLDDPEAAYQYETLDLHSLTAEICADLALLPEARFDLQSAEGVHVQGNSSLLRSAIENVLRNAIKYTAKGSSIRVRLSVENNQAVLRVADRGPGVPEQQLEAIFKPFYRTSEARTPGANGSTGGYGVGLAIVQRVVESHGGSATARNRPDGGLEIELRLPLAS